MKITYVSWNIQYLGESKLDEEKTVMDTQVLDAMAQYIVGMDADIVIIMEVRLTEMATEAVKQIRNLLGEDWSIFVTSNDGNDKPDRYGVLWKHRKVFLRAQFWLDKDTQGNKVVFPNRYPSLFQFFLLPLQEPLSSTYCFSIIVLHGPNPGEKNGESAKQAMANIERFSDVQVPPFPTIISGDFNVDYCLNSKPYLAFERFGYQVLLDCNNKTSLKFKFKTQDDLYGEYLKSAYDNIFLSSDLKLLVDSYGVFDFVDLSGVIQGLPSFKKCHDQPEKEDQWQYTLTQCRRVSDHLPVFVTLDLPPANTQPQSPPQ